MVILASFSRPWSQMDVNTARSDLRKVGWRFCYPKNSLPGLLRSWWERQQHKLHEEQIHTFRAPSSVPHWGSANRGMSFSSSQREDNFPEHLSAMRRTGCFTWMIVFSPSMRFCSNWWESMPSTGWEKMRCDNIDVNLGIISWKHDNFFSRFTFMTLEKAPCNQKPRRSLTRSR